MTLNPLTNNNDKNIKNSNNLYGHKKKVERSRILELLGMFFLC